MTDTRPFFLLALLLAGCQTDGGSGDGTGDTGDSGMTDTGEPGDTGGVDDNECTWLSIDRLSFDRAGGDSVSIVLECDDPTDISSAELEIPELGVLLEFEGEGDPETNLWKGKSLSELEELVAEKGLSFGMDVSKYNLDEDRVVVPQGDNISTLGARFHDTPTSFGDNTNAPGSTFTDWGFGITELAVQQIERGAGGASWDLDGDGSAEAIHAWVLSLDAEAGTLSAGQCTLGDGSDCAVEVAVKGIEADLPVSTSAVYGGGSVGSVFTPYASRSTEKDEVAFALAVPGADALSLHGVRGTGSGLGALSLTVPYETLGLAEGDGGTDASTAPVLAGVSLDYTAGAATAASAFGAVTASGVGTSSKDGGPLFWGATWKEGSTDKPDSSWTVGTSWSTILPEASLAIAGMGTEVVVFFGGTDTLELTSVDAASGKVLSTVTVGDLSLPLVAAASTQADLDGDGIPEVILAAVDASGSLSFVSGEPSTAVGLAKVDVVTPVGLVGRWSFDDAHGLDRSRLSLHASADSSGNVAVVATSEGLGEKASWGLSWMSDGTGAGHLGDDPDTVELLALDPAGVMLVPGADTCGPDEDSGSKQAGFCGLLLAGNVRLSGRVVTVADYGIFVEPMPGVEPLNMDWRGAGSRGIPLADTQDYVVVATDGIVEVYDRGGNVVGAPLPLRPTADLSVGQVDGRLVVFGAATVPQEEDAVYAQGDMLLVLTDMGGSQDTVLLKTGDDEFQIPEKVVMEKDTDFYGNASGATTSGMTLTWTSYTDTDKDGSPDTATLSSARIEASDLPVGKGESTMALSSTALGSASVALDPTAGVYGGVQNPLTGAPLGPEVVMVRRRTAKKAEILPDPRYSDRIELSEMAGVETVADFSSAATIEDLVAVVPWDSTCGFATVLVPGLSTDWSSNLKSAVVLSSAVEEDCSDLAVPVGGMDVDGSGVNWPVLAQTDGSSTTFREVVWDGARLLMLPGVTIEGAGLDRVDIGDFDGDGVDELAVSFYRLRRDNVMNRLGRDRVVFHTGSRSLAPLDSDALDFSAERTVSFGDLDDAAGGLDSSTLLDVVDSQDAGITDITEPWFYVVDGLEGQRPLGTWSRRDTGDTAYRSTWNGGRTAGAYTYSFWIKP